MANFTLTINLDNAAFEEAPDHEVARILKDAAHRIENGFYPEHTGGMVLKDINGNTVGRAVHTTE